MIDSIVDIKLYPTPEHYQRDIDGATGAPIDRLSWWVRSRSRSAWCSGSKGRRLSGARGPRDARIIGRLADDDGFAASTVERLLNLQPGEFEAELGA